MTSCPLCSCLKITQVYDCHRYIGKSQKIQITVGQCENCGFVFNSNRLSDDELKDYYQNSLHASGQVYRDTSSGSHYPILHAERANFLKNSINIDDAGLFIDVGCGSGGFIEAARKELPQFEYIGLDPSENAVNICNEKGIKVFPKYLEELDLHNEDVSIISAISVLEHTTDPSALLKSCVDKLKVDGILYLEVPNMLEPELQLTGFFNLEHVVHFTPHTLVKLLREVGFKYFKIDKSTKNTIRIVACMQKSNITNPYLEHILDDRKNSINAIEQYILAEQNLNGKILQKLKKTFEFWKEKKFTIAVYGAGAHTIELASIFNIRKYVKFYIDGDPRKKGSDFLGRQIIAPSEIKENNVDAVLISSGRFQTEMMSLISHYDIKIETCYD